MPDVLTPFTAAVEKLSKKDATSILIALFLVYALIAFGISASVTGSLRWLVGSTGSVSFLTGVGAFVYTTLFKPDRLRAEETVRMGMLLDWISVQMWMTNIEVLRQRCFRFCPKRNHPSALLMYRRISGMSDKLYAIILDQLDPSFDPSALRDVVKTFDGISHWWNHMPSCFLVNSSLSAEQLADWLHKHTGDLGFLVIETNPHNSEGHLPERSWTWLRHRESELAVSN